jgi:hypothetical protein
MPFNFPSNPSLGTTYTFDNKTWVWNGYAWNAVTVVVSGGGGTGFAPVPLATESITGVASFNITDFTVSLTGHVRIKTGINATNIVVLGTGGTGGVGKLPAVDGSELLEVNAKYLNGKINSQITDGGTF